MKTILLLLISTGLLAQVHEEKPLPKFTPEPVKAISEEITGWSYSRDGQWVSSPGTIPVRIISTNEEKYELDENELGLDNIQELRLYGALYGTDTLAALVKIYKTGSYRTPAINRGWQTQTEAYFFLFPKDALKELREIPQETTIIKIDLWDHGSLGRVKPRRVLQSLRSSTSVWPSNHWQLVMTARRGENDKVYFQLAAMHATFGGVEGVLKDFTRKGESLYGKPRLLDYLHYELDATEFHGFFNLDTELSFGSE